MADETPVQTAERMVAEIDTYGDPRVYALAAEFIRLAAALSEAETRAATLEKTLRRLGHDAYSDFGHNVVVAGTAKRRASSDQSIDEFVLASIDEFVLAVVGEQQPPG